MDRLTVFFLRHGETSGSQHNLFCGGYNDLPLTREGEEMAEEFAAAYQTTQWQAIYASPLTRAQSTAAPVARRSGVPIRTREELREIDFGVWDGKSLQEVLRDYHDDYHRWSADPAVNPPTNGQRAVDLARNVREVVGEIQREFSGGNVLIVSHKATIRIALCDLLGIDISRFRDRLICPVASVSIVQFGDRGPILTAIGDRSFQSERLRSRSGT